MDLGTMTSESLVSTINAPIENVVLPPGALRCPSRNTNPAARLTAPSVQPRRLTAGVCRLMSKYWAEA